MSLKQTETSKNISLKKETKLYYPEFSYLEPYFNGEKRLFDKAKIVSAVNIKGGVGKSTIVGNILKLPNSVIINLDEAQNPTSINSNSIETINYYDYKDKVDIVTMIETLRENYDYIIIDTPGALNEEVLKILPLINYFIVPFVEGLRSITATINVTVMEINEILEGLVVQGKMLNRKDKWAFVYNRYKNEFEFQVDKKELENIFKDILQERFKTLAGLKNSDVIRHLENHGKNIEEFYNEQPTYCYKFFGQASIFNKKLYKDFFELDKVARQKGVKNV